MTSPKLSVLIPCYNTAETLEESFASVFTQTFTDFEVIAVDDGSEDDTLSLLEEMANSAILLYPITFPHETFALVVAEALTQGCIPITRDFTGISTTSKNAGVLLTYEGKKPMES